mmetsp:Transcript_82793/g.222307  ORF Transcript_82793/g.222307 Transcript_82793/m.222307 type:complete len:88 (+) Transcript_82793:508-771(+)
MQACLERFAARGLLGFTLIFNPTSGRYCKRVRFTTQSLALKRTYVVRKVSNRLSRRMPRDSTMDLLIGRMVSFQTVSSLGYSVATLF